MKDTKDHKKGRQAPSLGSERGVALVATLAVSMVVMAMGISYFKSQEMESTLTFNETVDASAFYAAEAGIQRGLVQLRGSKNLSNWGMRVNTGTGCAEIAGSGVANIQFILDAGSSTRGRLIATGNPNGREEDRRTIIVEVKKQLRLPGLDGAASLVGPSGSKGNFTIDGRDHDITNYLPPNFLPGTGTYAIYTDTGIQFDASNNTNIGGTQDIDDGGADVTPTEDYADGLMGDGQFLGWNSVAEINAPDLPHSPDEVLALNAGTMEAYAKSHGTYYGPDLCAGCNPEVGVGSGPNLTLKDGEIYYLEVKDANKMEVDGILTTMVEADNLESLP